MALEDKSLEKSLASYCRIDDLSDQGDADFLEECYLAAVDYMADAGVSEPKPGSGRYAKYKLCIKPLDLDMWDNRGTQISGTAMSDNMTFQRIKNQLKFTEPVSDSDTGLSG